MRRSHRRATGAGTRRAVPAGLAVAGQGSCPVGRSFASTSATPCLLVAMAQKGPHALGNHAGEEVLMKIAAEAGLRSWNLATETVTNRIYEVKQ